MSIKDKSRDELEHAELNLKMDNLQSELTVHLDTGFRMVYKEIQHFSEKLENTDKKIDKLKGEVVTRIEVLEKDTDIIRSIKKYRIAAWFALLGLISVTNFSDIKAWITKMLPW